MVIKKQRAYLRQQTEHKLLRVLFNKQKGIAVHLLFIIIKDIDRITDLLNGSKDIDRHGFRGGPRHFGVLTQLSYPGTGLTEVTGIHKEEKSLIISR